MTTSDHLTDRHRNTLFHLEQHPTPHSIEWNDVLSLLHAAGTVTEKSNGKIEVRLGEELLFLTPPHHKDIGEQLMVDLRRALRTAGFAAGKK
jgi:hypothetical protein